MIETITEYWNPVFTGLATLVSLSLLGFQIYQYRDRQGEVYIESIDDAKILTNFELSFTLNARNTGINDVYIRSVSVDYNGESLGCVNVDSNTTYTEINEKPVHLSAKKPINHLHNTNGKVNFGYANEVEADVVVKTNNQTLRETVTFEREEPIKVHS